MFFHDNLGSVLRRGFTLVEILVVLILMGLMAGLVAPSIIGTGQSDDPVSELRELVRSASAAAVKQGEVVQLSLASTGQWELVGTASSPPDEIASGQLKSSGPAMTLLFSPLGTCAPDLRSEEAVVALILDPIMCDFPAERAIR
jgi:type II secretion system protein H